MLQVPQEHKKWRNYKPKCPKDGPKKGRWKMSDDPHCKLGYQSTSVQGEAPSPTKHTKLPSLAGSLAATAVLSSSI